MTMEPVLEVVFVETAARDNLSTRPLHQARPEKAIVDRHVVGAATVDDIDERVGQLGLSSDTEEMIAQVIAKWTGVGRGALEQLSRTLRAVAAANHVKGLPSQVRMSADKIVQLGDFST